jgi:uncharacterized protein YecE (DUF72 family)
MIFIGCCGFPISMKKYYKEFSVIEIQQTFYQIPKLETLERWRREAPEEFEFIIKAWQGVTHPYTSPTWRRYKGELWGEKTKYGNLQYSEEVLRSWEETIEAADKLGCNKIVIQLPPRLEWGIENKDDIMKTLDEFLKKGLIIIVEPRNNTWLTTEVRNYFRHNNIVHCVDPFKNNPFNTGSISYFRLHGRDGYKYSYKYTDKDLEELSDIVINISRRRDCYVMFNNKFMYEDAKRFRKLLQEMGLEAE